MSVQASPVTMPIWSLSMVKQGRLNADRVMRCQPRELVTLCEKKRVRAYNQGIGLPLGYFSEGFVDIACSAGIQDISL
jgi:hypothetical protein